MEKMTNAYTTVNKRDGTVLVRRHRSRVQHNIKMDLKNTGFICDCI